jgi:hypothetical protein
MSVDHAAQRVLWDVVKSYESFNSYSDSGEVRHQQRDTNSLVPSVSFATFFKKPSIFLFEFSTPHPYAPIRHRVTEYAVGTDGNNCFAFSQRPNAKLEMKTLSNLSTLVAGATGISMGSVHTIGKLLLPQIGGQSLLDLAEPRLDLDATISGTECYVINAIHPRGTRFEIFIEKSTLLLRKLIRSGRSEEHGSDFVVEETRDNIHLDASLDHSVFKSQCAKSCLTHIQIQI